MSELRQQVEMLMGQIKFMNEEFANIKKAKIDKK